MVQRGRCNNPTKVRNIQSIGGSVALIADSVEESLEQLVMEDSTGNTETLTIAGYMIDHDAARDIAKTLETQKVFLKSELLIQNDDNRLEIGLFLSSSVDVDPEVMETFSRLAYESAITAHESAIQLRIHTFSCPSCPAFIKTEDCVSDG